MSDPKYPRGKIHPDDQGELALRVFVDAATSTVIVHFSSPVTWIGFASEHARDVAAKLIACAERIENGEKPSPKPEA